MSTNVLVLCGHNTVENTLHLTHTQTHTHWQQKENGTFYSNKFIAAITFIGFLRTKKKWAKKPKQANCSNCSNWNGKPERSSEQIDFVDDCVIRKNFIVQSVFEKLCFVAAVCLNPFIFARFSLSIEFLSILFSGSLHIQPLLLNLGKNFSTAISKKQLHNLLICGFILEYLSKWKTETIHLLFPICDRCFI